MEQSISLAGFACVPSIGARGGAFCAHYNRKALEQLEQVEQGVQRAQLESERAASLVKAAILNDDVSLLTRLHRAGVQFDRPSLVIDRVGQRACSPLFLAIERGMRGAFSFLISKNARVDQPEPHDGNEMTPLHYSLETRKWVELNEMVRCVRPNCVGEIVSTRPEIENRLLLSLLLHREKDTKECLSHCGVDKKRLLNEVQPGLSAPLSFALMADCQKTQVKFLVEDGADPFQADGKGFIPARILQAAPIIRRYLDSRRVTIQIHRTFQEIVDQLPASIAGLFKRDGGRVAFQITKKLGQGSFKNVYEITPVEFQEPQRVVHMAFGKIRKATGRLLAEFKEEVLISKEISTVTPYAVRPFLVEYEGKVGKKFGMLMNRCIGTLGECIAQMSPEERYLVAVQIVAALCVIHASGLIHGDVKDKNVLIQKEGIEPVTALLADYGGFQKIGEEASHQQTFPPPEILRCKREGLHLITQPSIDMWALSDLLFMLLMSNSHSSLFLNLGVCYNSDEEATVDAFLPNAERASHYLCDRAKSDPCPARELIAELASMDARRRPSSVYVLSKLLRVAESLGYEKVVETALAEFRRLVHLIQRLPNKFLQDQLRIELSSHFMARDARLAFDLIRPIGLFQERELLCLRLMEKLMERGDLELALEAGNRIEDTDRKSGAFQEIAISYVRHNRLIEGCDIADAIQEQANLIGAFQMIVDHVLPQLSNFSSEQLFHLVEKLARHGLFDEAERLSRSAQEPELQQRFVGYVQQQKREREEGGE